MSLILFSTEIISDFNKQFKSFPIVFRQKKHKKTVFQTCLVANIVFQ